MSSSSPVDILILGAGWTATFLIPLCVETNVNWAATTRSGSTDPYTTIPFDFDQDDESEEKLDEQCKKLPDAKTVLVTFPLTTKGAVGRLVQGYRKARKVGRGGQELWVQLGTTSIWDNPPNAPKPTSTNWYDRHSSFTKTPRVALEEELLTLPETKSSVLCLSGLWGGTRDPKNYVGRVAPTKEALKAKDGLHLIHGQDVARAILAVHLNPSKTVGQRWLLTDGRVYDWWDIASAWSEEKAQWVRELMHDESVRALPRDISTLGRALDSRDFWDTFELVPVKARV
ncbi:hypothetical protein EDD18DRAFT_1307608 [Armillaria luteobubalina]|uniref:NAD(P)-binding domain-containing protein n=1 Tax=Armillaria luteobubalina TaxID=153913 RepID=A0AA39URQ4_9AGAR|nr:hypothetical protein EDD18DRAFT_1307608 [Armillaria luteobubalina]